LNSYDTIIIGAGHNGLACAAYLAKGGRRVLVLEAAAAPGGLAANYEFHPGFRIAAAHSVSHFSRQVADDLDLAAHGYAGGEPLPMIGLGIDGRHVTFRHDVLEGAGADDASRYRDYCRLLHRLADALKPFWLKTIPAIGSGSLRDALTFGHIGLNLRRLGKRDMREMLRIATLPVRDLMDEYFTSPLAKAALCWDGLIGSKMAPRSPNSAILAILYRMSEASRGAHAIPAGGIGSLIDALAASAAAAGAEIRCAAPVERVIIEADSNGLAACGVELENGERIPASLVVSATDPQRTFLDLVGVEHLEIGFTNRIRRLRCDGYVAKLHLALSGLPRFDGLEDASGRMILAPDMDAIEFAWDEAKHGGFADEPVMELLVPSMHDASLAPSGQHVLSANVMYVPHRLRGGWTDEAREEIMQRAIDTIARYAPAIREQIVHGELLTPADLERRYRVTGGHWHHTDFALDQLLMMRPTYEAAQYATPIAGLYVCGAGSHPAGDLTGMAGHNAAREILR
jgi:phytoene dehydrogenase-like protein